MKAFFIWLFSIIITVIGLIFYEFSSILDKNHVLLSLIVFLPAGMLLFVPATKWWEKYLTNLFNKKD